MKKSILFFFFLLCAIAAQTQTIYAQEQKAIKVLAIGNSFSVDGMEYFDELAKAAGIPLITGNLYIGGCSLERHWNNAQSNAPEYTYFKNVFGNDTKKDKATILDGIKDENWDFITFQQVSQNSGQGNTFFPFLTELTSFVKQNATNPNVRFVMHQTWAYAGNSTHAGFANYDRNQERMYNAIVHAIDSAAKQTGIVMTIPSGTAIQNGRSSFLGDVFCRDGYHLNLTLGRYTAACAWFETICGQSAIGNKFLPEGMSENVAYIAQKSAHDACINPNAVTPEYNAKDSITIYVSTKGDNNGTGDSAQPLASLQAACDKAAEIRKRLSPQAPIIIKVAAGTYNTLKPLTLTPEHSGTEKSPLIIRGEGMNNTIISGGVKLPSFKTVSERLWTIDMSGTLISGGTIQQLFVNGQRATCARTPNEGSLFKIQNGNIAETAIDSVPPRNATRDGFSIQKIKIPAEAVEALDKTTYKTNIIINVLHAWDLTRRYLDSYSKDDASVYVSGDQMKPWNKMDNVSQFYLENDISFLDVPGEWFYDSGKMLLYYIPQAGEKANESQAVMTSSKQLVILSGTEKEHASNIKFENLSLQHTSHIMGRKGENPMQAAQTTDATVMVDFANNIEFTNCEIAHSGNNAVWIRKGCRDNKIRHCYFHDLGIGAIKIGDYKMPENEEIALTKGNIVDNNIFKSGSRVFPTGVGITIFHSSDNTITHNDISDFYYSGMSVGWVWGYTHSPSKRNIIKYNHIHHIGWGILSDMGGVYTLGASEGTEVSNNVIHDVYSYGYGGWGLYTDEGSTGIKMENNLVYNCKSSGFHQHYGKENIIRNNIFINQIKAQLEATRIEEHLSFTFANNIVYYTQGKMYDKNWEKANFKADSNCYWHEGGDTSFDGMTLKEWQTKTGKDKNSIIMNPMFKDIKNNDFTIGNKTMMKKIKFIPFDYTKAGVYGDNDWKKLSELPKQRIDEYNRTVDEYEK